MIDPICLEIFALETSPLPISLSLIKKHLAVNFTDQDELLEKYLIAAILAFEGTTHRTIIERDHHWMIRDFPRDESQRIWIPRGRTQRVQEISYVANGVTLSLFGPSAVPGGGHHSPAILGDDYQEELRMDHGGFLMPLQGQSWPSVDSDAIAPVTIHFSAGWAASELPPDILNALLFYIHISLDDLRGAVDPVKHAANLQTWEALISGYRLSRWY